MMTNAELGLSLAMWQDDVLEQESKQRQKRFLPKDKEIRKLFKEWENSYSWETEAFHDKNRLIGMKEVSAAFEAGFLAAKKQ